MPTTRNYEAVVILEPGLPDDQLNTSVDKLTNMFKESGANLLETSRWGRRRLAYPIKKKAEGYYVIFYFTLGESNQVLTQFERICRYDERVMRHLVIKVPTHKRGQEISQLVPTPGYLADFKIEPREQVIRRRLDSSRAREQAAAMARESRPEPSAEESSAALASMEAPPPVLASIEGPPPAPASENAAGEKE